MCRIEALQYPSGATKGCHACPPQSNDLSPNRQGPIHNTTKQGSEFSPSSRSFAPIWIHIVSTFSRLCQLIQFSNYSYLRHWYTRAVWRTDKQSLYLSVHLAGFDSLPQFLTLSQIFQDYPFVEVIIDFAPDCRRKENVMRKNSTQLKWEKTMSEAAHLGVNGSERYERLLTRQSTASLAPFNFNITFKRTE